MDLDQIVSEHVEAKEKTPVVLAGYINKAPATYADGAYVIIPEFSDDHDFGPCPWQPRGTAMPQKGDDCIVVFDENQKPWIAAWKGNTTGGPSDATPLMDGTATPGTSLEFARGDHRHPTDTSRAPLASPVFTGNPQAPTPATSDDDTSIATTAFVQALTAASVGTSITVFNVKTDFGAVGDFTTDDTDAILDAIAACIAAGGGIIYFPAGIYKISGALDVDDNIILRGAGRDVSVIYQTDTSEHGITGHEIHNFTMEDMSLTGPNAGSGKGIYFTRDLVPLGIQYRMSFSRMIVRTFGGNGIDLVQPITSDFNQVEVQSCGGHGFSFTAVSGGAAATSLDLHACYANGNGTNSGIAGATGSAGFYFNGMTYCALSGCATDNFNVGYFLEDCFSVSLSGCGTEVGIDAGSEPYKGDSFRLEGSWGITLVSPYVYRTGRHGVYVLPSALHSSAADVTIIGISEFNPEPGAVSSIRFDADTGGTVLNCGDITNPMSIDAGAMVTEIQQNYSTFPGDLFVGGDLTLFGAGGEKSLTFMPDAISVGSGATPQANPTGMADPDFIQIADGLDGYLGMSFIVPEDFTDFGTMDVTLLYTTSLSGGNIAVKLNAAATAVGDPIFSTYTTSSVEAIPAPATAEDVIETTLAATVPTAGGLERGHWCRMTLGFTRSTDAGVDTCTGNLRLLGVRLNYT